MDNIDALLNADLLD